MARDRGGAWGGLDALIGLGGATVQVDLRRQALVHAEARLDRCRQEDLKRAAALFNAAQKAAEKSADRLQGESLVGHILLTRGERSELSNIAANKL